MSRPAAGAAGATLFCRPPDQFGFVVPDLMESVDWHRSVLGLGPWSVYEYDARLLTTQTYLGRPAQWATRSAVLPGAGYSLVEPVSGTTTYTEMLTARGPGLHHVAYRVTDLGSWRPRMLEHGFVELMTGAGHGQDGDGEFAFFGAASMPGCHVELIEPPGRRRPPVSVIG